MSDEAVFLLVVALRLGVPLLIPRFPLPAILAALVIDAADQTIFQNNTDLNLDGYQGYDKALDVYYLTIAYLSTIRNWTDPFAFHVAQFLWYYRLVGVVLFELTEVRALLLIFPNTFEYFFIAYETVRLWWDPARLAKRQVIAMAAAIWIFIKLPQEWWIHIAQLDFTDFMKEDVFGVSADTSWGEAIGENLWFVGLLVVVAILVVIGIRRLRQVLPPPDWSVTFDVDKRLDRRQLPTPSERPAIFSWYMFEKIALVSLVSLIFALVLPDADPSLLQLALPVAFIIIVNSFVSHWLALRGRTWESTIVEFFVMAAVNGATAVVLIALTRWSDEPVNEAALAFFVLLLTLIVTLFDRYHQQVASAAPRHVDAGDQALRAR